MPPSDDDVDGTGSDEEKKRPNGDKEKAIRGKRTH